MIKKKWSNIERSLTEENQKLISLAKEEGLAETDLDLPSLRKSHQDVVIRSLPLRTYSQFLLDSFSKTRIVVHESTKRNMFRIDRIPKSVKDFAKRHGITLNSPDSYRFTYNRKTESDEIELLQNDSPLFELAMECAAQDIQQVAALTYQVPYPIEEQLKVNMYLLSIGDGTGRELFQAIKIIGKKSNGTFMEIDPYWLFYSIFEEDIQEKESTGDEDFKNEIIRIAEENFKTINFTKDQQLYKMQQFLRRTFENQYKGMSDKLTNYYLERDDHQSIAIQQLKNNLEEIERKKEERLGEVIREQTVFLKPIQNILQLELIPNGNRPERMDPAAYLNIVADYERMAGRFNLKAYSAYALVDYSSEDHNGILRNIILLPYGNMINKQHLEDLEEIKDLTYVYIIKDKKIVNEHKLDSLKK